MSNDTGGARPRQREYGPDDGVFGTGEIYDAVTIPDYIAISVLLVLIVVAAARLFARSKP